jgi:hypothetical protein
MLESPSTKATSESEGRWSFTTRMPTSFFYIFRLRNSNLKYNIDFSTLYPNVSSNLRWLQQYRVFFLAFMKSIIIKKGKLLKNMQADDLSAIESKQKLVDDFKLLNEISTRFLQCACVLASTAAFLSFRE